MKKVVPSGGLTGPSSIVGKSMVWFVQIGLHAFALPVAILRNKGGDSTGLLLVIEELAGYCYWRCYRLCYWLFYLCSLRSSPP